MRIGVIHIEPVVDKANQNLEQQTVDKLVWCGCCV
jgi:hypothetical protein